MLKSYKYSTLITSLLISSVLFSGAILASTTTSADVVDNINITVPVACNFSELADTTDTPHTATINPGTYQEDIGKTTFRVFCNDSSGYALYAIGYSNEEYGNTNLLPANTAFPSIATGLATSGDVSAWAMKLNPVAGTYTPTIGSDTNGSFANYHIVPDTYTKVATFTSTTDFTIGSSLTSTYRAYVHGLQPADTYNGKVKYTLVHPNDAPIPDSTLLDTGIVVAGKMKTLAAGTETSATASTDDIKAIRMADSLPEGFVATEANTVSAPTSRNPIYIFYDNTDDAGIMYFYSGGYQVVMNPNSDVLFALNTALSDISGLSSWDASNVTFLASFFYGDTSITSLSALSNWNTSSLTDLYAAFYRNTNLTDISALANWDTSNVTNLQGTFAYNTNLSNISALANWDTSNVTTLEAIFNVDSSLTDISALADWNTSNVTTLQHAFSSNSSLTDISALANWDTSNVTTLRSTFNGDFGLTDISALANWDTSNVTTLQYTFAGNSSLTDISVLANWDTSRVTNMNFAFGMGAGESKTGDPIIDLSPLANWDVSNVTDMSSMFQNNNIASFLPLSNWDVGKVKDFSNTFNQTNKSTTTSLAGLENWDVSSATNMGSMFYDSVSLVDASAINNWNITNVQIGTGSEDVYEGFNRMFGKAPVHPNFTKRPGTWNSSGTFIPST